MDTSNEKPVVAADRIEETAKAKLAVAKEGPTKVTDLALKVEFNPKQIEAAKRCIQVSVKEASAITARIFDVMRECDDADIAAGTFTVAEGRFVNDYNDATPGSTCKSLREVCSELGITLSYSQIKSTLIQAWKIRDVHLTNYQARMDQVAKLTGGNTVTVSDQWLNPHSRKYEGKDGWRKYTADLRLSLAAKRAFDAENGRQERERANATSNGPAPANDVNGGLRSGGRTEDVLPVNVQTALNQLIVTVHDTFEMVDEATMLETLRAASNVLRTAYDRKVADHKAEVAKAGTKPVVVPDELPELDDEDEQNIKEVESGIG